MVNPEKYTGDNGSYDYYHPGPGGYIYIYIPGTCLSSILVVEPSKTRSFPIKTRVIWVPGIYIYIPTLTLIDPIQTINYSCIAVKVNIPFSLM